MQQQHLNVRGRSITYRAAGAGPAVVLIHGMAGSSESWRPLIEALAPHASVIAVDLPGHGGSTNPGGDYSLGAHASCVRDLMVALGVRRATLVGHSFGGGVAMQTAYQFPDRCERLVLVDSGGLGRDLAWWLRALALPGSEFVLSVGCSGRVVGAGRGIARAIRRAGFTARASTAEVARCYASLAEPAARATLLHTLRSVIGPSGQRVSATDRLSLAAELPTMIVWGERDAMIPVRHAREAHAAIPGSRLEVIDAAGHFPHLDEPERFAEILQDFLASTSPASLSDEYLHALLTADPA